MRTTIHQPRSVTAIALGLALLLGFACGDDDSPTNPGDGPIRVPGDYATIGEAITAAKAGDVIALTADEYSLDASILVKAKADLIVRGETDSGARPVLSFSLDANTDAIAIESDCVNVTIEGITIVPAMNEEFRHGIVIRGDGTEVRDCRIEDARTNSIHLPGSVADVLIERNYLIRSGLFGVACNAGADPIVLRNTIVDTGDCGLYSFDSDPMMMRNIIVRSANWGIACFGPSLPTISCNALYENVTADYSPMTPAAMNDILMDPGFCEENSFSLLHTSPCTAENSVTCDVIGASDEVCEGS